jgi:hypothetical protein
VAQAEKILTAPQRFQTIAQHNYLKPALPHKKGDHFAMHTVATIDHVGMNRIELYQTRAQFMNRDVQAALLGVAFTTNCSILEYVLHHNAFRQVCEMFFRQCVQWRNILQELVVRHRAGITG